MTSILCTLPLKFAACAAALLPVAMPPSTQGHAPAGVVELDARFDSSLGTLRAGRAEAPAPFGARELTVLSSAQEDSTSLTALRAGSGPTDGEWKWLAVGAGVVLLIVLL